MAAPSPISRAPTAVRPGPVPSPRPRGYTGSASVTVNNGSYTDLNGNVGTGQQ
ncbi:hypothetical protein [Aeromonas veronii]|uniref:hypothetical protein n=1 Tax=Aeromonas veronii TaxID=654 RepID=UPI003CE52070